MLTWIYKKLGWNKELFLTKAFSTLEVLITLKMTLLDDYNNGNKLMKHQGPYTLVELQPSSSPRYFLLHMIH